MGDFAMTRPKTNQEKVAARLRRAALPLAFLFGFIASWIALDPLGTGAVMEEQEIQRGLASASNKEHLESIASVTEDSVDQESEQAAENSNPASFENVENPEELRFDTNQDLWNGTAQLLPNPMFVEQLVSKRARDIRGGGWMAIDSAKGEIQRVELFKASSKKYTSGQAIEAKVVLSQDGRVLNTVNTGFPIVRGIQGIVQGPFDVPEIPSCLVHYAIVMTDKICDVPRPRGAGGALRFRFEAPLVGADSAESDFKFTTVYVESPEGEWTEIGSFNESFTPIGDPNRDGVPDFYLESVTESNERGWHDLLISNQTGDVIQYTVYSAAFLGR